MVESDRLDRRTAKLTEVQEFEADREVIASGHDAACYADLLFRQLCGFRPDIANGLYDSLTKKRFKMMTHFTSGSHALLRLTGMLAVTAGLIAAFSFTARAANRPLRDRTAPPCRRRTESISTILTSIRASIRGCSFCSTGRRST